MFCDSESLRAMRNRKCFAVGKLRITVALTVN